MERFRFEFLDKRRKETWLPRLFDMLYSNMKDIAPSGAPYEQEREAFLGAVGPALDREPRQIILMYGGEALAGYSNTMSMAGPLWWRSFSFCRNTGQQHF